ncbi:MAG: TSUP family transporter [Spirochaetales bacterium]|nr:TSUP family transporter [Spirochaetales bacterium]
MATLPPLAWTLVVLGGLAAGFIDSIAGGGGLITVPVLLAVGLPPHMALGTNKVQSVFGSGTAALRYGRKGLIPWRKISPGVILSLVASFLGAWTVKRINASALEMILPFLLLLLWLYVAFKKDLGDSATQQRLSPRLFYPLAGASIGFYDGFLGPGTGSFWTVSQVSLVGMDLKEATAATKPANFASNVGALAFFLFAGQSAILVGLAMAAGQVAGAWLGSHLVIHHRPRFIRPFFLTVVAATVAKLFWDQFAGILLGL